MQIWDKGYMNEGKVFVSYTKLKLAHCFDEGSRFDVSNCSSKLVLNSAIQPETYKPLKLTSTMHTSGSSSVSSDGTFETRSIQS